MKKPKKRVPVPRKPPKIEKPKKAYDRKTAKHQLKKLLRSVDNEM
jgi:hypothetical protein